MAIDNAMERILVIRMAKCIRTCIAGNASVTTVRAAGTRLSMSIDCVAGDSVSSLSRTAGGIVVAPSSDLIAAVCLLDVIVSADSAPVHLASAPGVAVAALFEERPEKNCADTPWVCRKSSCGLVQRSMP